MGKSTRWKYYQPNKKDLKDTYGDCVIRALTKTTGKEWLEVFEELLPYARELQCMPNNKHCYEKYLTENGFTYVGISNKKGAKRPTVQSFSKEHADGVYFLRVANHVVGAVDGYFYDTWDSGDCCLYGYWVKKISCIRGFLGGSTPSATFRTVAGAICFYSPAKRFNAL